jgi:hypothetical protein
MAFILILCGSTALTIGVYRSFVLARQALGPIIHEGDPTRTAIDAARPVHERERVRLVAARIAGSLGWLAVAMYGLYLVVRAAELPPG